MSKDKLDQLTRALTQVKSTDLSDDLSVDKSSVSLDSGIDFTDADSENIITIGGGALGATCSWFPTSPAGNFTIGSASSNVNYGVYNSGQLGSLTTNAGGLTVTGNAEFEGSVKIKGRDIGKLFEKMEDRLAILIEPDAAKLEKFAALKKAYDHYKILEKLIGED
jgi:hypothetical protein